MRSRGTSSSSPASWRMAMRPPVPMSTLPTKMVTEPSACTARNESTASGASGLPRKRSAPGSVWPAARPRPSSPRPTIRTPPAARKLRREMLPAFLSASPRSRRLRSAISAPARGRGGGAEDRANHAGVAATAAEVPNEGLPYLLLVGAGRAREEGARGHDHAGRAIPALRRLLRDECRLEPIGTVGRAQALDGDDLLTDHRARGGHARADRAPGDEHGAGAALGEAAAEAGARQPKIIAENVEQGSVGVIRLDLPICAVDPQRQLRHARPPWSGDTVSDGGVTRLCFGDATTRARRPPANRPTRKCSAIMAHGGGAGRSGLSALLAGPPDAGCRGRSGAGRSPPSRGGPRVQARDRAVPDPVSGAA